MIPQQTMSYGYIYLPTYQHVRVFARYIGKEIECKHHATVGAVFKRYNSVMCSFELHGREDIFDLGDGGERHRTRR